MKNSKMDGRTASMLLNAISSTGDLEGGADIYKEIMGSAPEPISAENRSWVKSNAGSLLVNPNDESDIAIVLYVNEATNGFYPGQTHPFVSITNTGIEISHVSVKDEYTAIGNITDTKFTVSGDIDSLKINPENELSKRILDVLTVVITSKESTMPLAKKVLKERCYNRTEYTLSGDVLLELILGRPIVRNAPAPIEEIRAARYSIPTTLIATLDEPKGKPSKSRIAPDTIGLYQSMTMRTPTGPIKISAVVLENPDNKGEFCIAANRDNQRINATALGMSPYKGVGRASVDDGSIVATESWTRICDLTEIRVSVCNEECVGKAVTPNDTSGIPVDDIIMAITGEDWSDRLSAHTKLESHIKDTGLDSIDGFEFLALIVRGNTQCD